MRRWLLLGTTSVLFVLVTGCSKPSSDASGGGGGSSLPNVTAIPGGGTKGHGSTQSTVGSTTSSTQPSSATTAFGGSDVPGETIFSQDGVGNATTRLFYITTSDSAWDLSWSYDCPGAEPRNGANISLGNFTFVVYKNSSPDRKDIGAGGSAASGQGTQHYTDTGDFQLHVGAQSSCVWGFTAVVPSK